MKHKIILLALMAFSVHAYSQTKNNLSLMYGFAANDVQNRNTIGDFSYKTQNAYNVGLGYTRELNKYFSIETGLSYSSNKTEENSFPSGTNNTYQNSVKLITLPLLARFTFLKYLYASAGLDVDIQIDHNGSIGQPSDQSGLGIEGGLGGKYDVGRFTLFIYPYLRNYNVVKFNKNSDDNLIGGGVKFGAGYNF